MGNDWNLIQRYQSFLFWYFCKYKLMKSVTDIIIEK